MITYYYFYIILKKWLIYSLACHLKVINIRVRFERNLIDMVILLAFIGLWKRKYVAQSNEQTILKEDI